MEKLLVPGEPERDDILDDETFNIIFSEQDLIYRERLIMQVADQAAAFKLKSQFMSLVKTYKTLEKQEKKINELEKSKQQKAIDLNQMTAFGSDIYPEMRCGSWFAGISGVYTNGNFGPIIACHHPVTIARRYLNVETGFEKIVIAFKKGGTWREVTCDKGMIASNNRIVALADRGVAVTSESAKHLVKYLMELEMLNMDKIDEYKSTSKLGWSGKLFIPYDKDILFDGDSRFKNLIADLEPCGHTDTWFDFVKVVRKMDRVEPRLMMAASFASVILKMCDALPFFVHLYGQTEGGKTLLLMLAASIWGNPSMKSSFTGDFLSTQTATEIRADVMNNLPYVMDDTAQVAQKYKDDFSGLIYTMCSGNGKDRSNQDLGLNRSYNWNCTFLTTGEAPIIKEYGQAGAANRVIEIEMGYEKIFADGNAVASLLNNNYGYAGRLFIDVIKEIGADEVRAIQGEMFRKADAFGKMKKQSLSLSMLLTADKIATDYLFKDGIYIDIEEAANMLKSESDISEDERCYQFIIGEIARNKSKFDSDEGYAVVECWGKIEGEKAFIIKNVFDEMCRNCNYSTAAFLKWANRKELIEHDSGRLTKKKRINGTTANTVCITISDIMDGFKEIEEE
ncbi:MAG: DUF927 domain-containing protein [Eubacterium sp.]